MEAARDKLHSHRLEKLPVFDHAGELHGLITAQDIIKIEQWPDATKDERGRLRVAAAVGVRQLRGLHRMPTEQSERRGDERDANPPVSSHSGSRHLAVPERVR